jgi:hypothetical protein
MAPRAYQLELFQASMGQNIIVSVRRPRDAVSAEFFLFFFFLLFFLFEMKWPRRLIHTYPYTDGHGKRQDPGVSKAP